MMCGALDRAKAREAVFRVRNKAVLDAVNVLIAAHIDEEHRRMEDAEAPEVYRSQGRIMALRALTKDIDTAMRQPEPA